MIMMPQDGSRREQVERARYATPSPIIQCSYCSATLRRLAQGDEHRHEHERPTATLFSSPEPAMSLVLHSGWSTNEAHPCFADSKPSDRAMTSTTNLSSSVTNDDSRYVITIVLKSTTTATSRNVFEVSRHQAEAEEGKHQAQAEIEPELRGRVRSSNQ